MRRFEFVRGRELWLLVLLIPAFAAAQDRPSNHRPSVTADSNRMVASVASDSMPALPAKEVITDPASSANKMPATLTVNTATLLELHHMRQSAVALCMQLPAKYRTRLPECAEIFKDEIQLEQFAKHKQ